MERFVVVPRGHQPLALVAMGLDFLVQPGWQEWDGLIIVGHDVASAFVRNARPSVESGMCERLTCGGVEAPGSHRIANRGFKRHSQSAVHKPQCEIRSINERIRAQIAQQLLALPFIVHEIEPLAVVLPLGLLLSNHEQLAELIPVPIAPCPSRLLEPLESLRSEGLEDLVLHAEEKLTAAGIALAAGAAEELTVDADRLMALGCDHMQSAGGRDAGHGVDVRHAT